MDMDVAFKISANVNGQQAVDKLAESLKRVGTQGEMSAKQLANAMRMVPAQLTDIATQLAGGQSPFLILMQQGGQLRDMFGSVGGAITGVGRTLAAFINPVTLTIGAIAGLAAVAYKGADQSAELNKQLLLTGGAAGFTAGQIEQMTRALRDTQGISAGIAREITTGLASSGQFMGPTFETAQSAIAKLQKLSGQSAEEIVKDFSRMSGSVAAWAAEHNKQYNYLTYDQFRYIKGLEDMGNKEAAMRENIKLLDAALEGRRRNLGYLESAWEGLKRAASGAWDAMLAVGRDKTPEDGLAAVRKQLDALDRVGRDQYTAYSENATYEAGTAKAKAAFDAKREFLLEQIRILQRSVTKAQDAAQEDAKAKAAERQKIEDEQSGKLNSIRNANIGLELAQLRGAAEQRIALLEQEGQRVENLYKAGVITEEKYSSDKLQIAKSVLNERMRLAEQEMAAENKRPANTQADVLVRETRLQQLRNELAKLNASSTDAELKAEGERAAYLRQMNDEVAKFARTQQARIDQIRNEADAIGMSTLEYKKHTEALRIDKEAADAAKGKSPDYVAAIMSEAEAMKKATAAALDYANEKSRSFSSGIQDAMKDYVENVANAARQSKSLFQNAFKGMEDAMVEFAMTGKMNFRDLANSIIKDMIRIAIQSQVLGPIANMFRTGLGSLTAGTTAGGSSLIGDFPALAAVAADGKIFQNGKVTAFASGGVVTGPTLFPMAGGAGLMGEAGPEAVMPLKRGKDGKLGVVSAGGSGTTNINVTVATDGSISSSGDSGDGRRLGQAIAVAIRQELIQQKRPGGLLSPV